MADITKCEPKLCTIKEQCYRYKAKADKFWQSYFTKEPGVLVNGKTECEYFWDNGVGDPTDDTI